MGRDQIRKYRRAAGIARANGYPAKARAIEKVLVAQLKEDGRSFVRASERDVQAIAADWRERE